MTDFKVGDRIKGKRGTSHKGKTGVVTEIPTFPTSGWIGVLWDGGKRKSITRKQFIELEV